MTHDGTAEPSDAGDDADERTVERLRTWYAAPPDEQQRAAARRFLDSLAESPLGMRLLPRTRTVPAWELAEGDELPAGHRVVEVRREPRGWVGS